MPNQPVVILGMHRSGTTMISKLLEDLGLFMGAEKEINNEALFFWEINNWIFELHTATAEKPYNMRYTNPACRKVIQESLAYFVHSARKKKYLGSLNGQYNSLRDLDIPWGWKDPKNTFVLDFWKSLFPEPKIIHVYRNPIDCVASYMERDLVLKNNFEWNWKKKLKRDYLVSRTFHENFRLYDLEQGFLLWEEYVLKASSLKYDNKNFLEIKYEDFLENPRDFIRHLIDFCDLQPNEGQIEQALSPIKKDRAYAFTQNEEYRTFYKNIQNNETLQVMGYGNLV